MLIEPLNRSLVFFPNIADNPNDYFGIVARRIGDNFTKMIVIGIFKLIFNDYLSAGAFFFRQNINLEISNVGLNFGQFNINADFLAEQIKIFLLSEPVCKVRLNAPNVA